MDAERNLLFGVLALQGDLIDWGQFAAACTAWAAGKDRPPAHLLHERGGPAREATTEGRVRGVDPSESRVMRSGGPIWSRRAPIWFLASSRRDGVTSRACMDADTSRRTTEWRAEPVPP